ncbi:alkaline ceramidase 3 [Piromyces finnis]|uniref:Alkaline ceramidase 3 n=1 Tax=Piromyces finnis TaxID=1754191 RepID=A0A1Y1VI06_9FUNG|nr:alkaline ceramidase 3 [Piromyces finnis]|eukprot:ORX55411.1 alkaline ceramidase 3 [Piromyces finnis]
MIYNSIYNLNGYWSPTTSSIDWCEENYTMTKYIAEFWNTLSNGIYIAFALIGIWFVKKYHYEKRYFWAYFGLLCIGIGSWLFHMTLKYQMELADELPMIYTCCISIYCIFETSNIKTYRPYILINLWIIALLFTVIYTEIISWPWFQHGAIIFLIGVIIYRSLYYIHDLSNTNALKKNLSIQKHLNILRVLLVVCAFTYALAFLLWNIDNTQCNYLISLRNKYPSLKFLFQFHAWWHILTGIGTYYYFIFSQYLRNIICDYEYTQMEWLFHLVPYVSRSYKHTL